MPDRLRGQPREGTSERRLKVGFKICFRGPVRYLLDGHLVTFGVLAASRSGA